VRIFFFYIVEGNKRTTLVVVRPFLALNCADIRSMQGHKYTTFIALARGSLEEAERARWGA